MKELDSIDFTKDTPILDLPDAIPLNGRAVHHAGQWSRNVPYGNLCAQAAMRIRALEEEVKAMKSNWTSVKERLPEANKTVLAWDGHFALAWINKGFWDEDHGEIGTVTHWQPLPDAPDAAERGRE